MTPLIGLSCNDAVNGYCTIIRVDDPLNLRNACFYGLFKIKMVSMFHCIECGGQSTVQVCWRSALFNY